MSGLVSCGTARTRNSEGNNKLRTDDRLEIFLHFFAELVVRDWREEKFFARDPGFISGCPGRAPDPVLRMPSCRLSRARWRGFAAQPVGG
jgi:hypothetical protein